MTTFSAIIISILLHVQYCIGIKPFFLLFSENQKIVKHIYNNKLKRKCFFYIPKLCDFANYRVYTIYIKIDDKNKMHIYY